MNPILYYEVEGIGQPIVLLPGMLATTTSWKDVTSILKVNSKVIALDLLGFGKSKAPISSEYTINDHVESIHKTLESVEKDRVILVGHSMGALIAASYAARFPTQVKKLILISPPIFKSRIEAKHNITKNSRLPHYLLYGNTAKITCLIACLLFRRITQAFIPFFLKDMPSTIAKDSLLHTWWSYSRTLTHVIENQNVCRDLKKLDMPIKIIYGQNDTRIIQQNIEELKDCNKKVEIRRVKNADHFIQFRKPKVIAQEIFN